MTVGVEVVPQVPRQDASDIPGIIELPQWRRGRYQRSGSILSVARVMSIASEAPSESRGGVA